VQGQPGVWAELTNLNSAIAQITISTNLTLLMSYLNDINAQTNNKISLTHGLVQWTHVPVVIGSDLS
jgi:hypothetical protein